MTQTNDGGATDLTTDDLKRLAASITPLSPGLIYRIHPTTGDRHERE